MKEDWIKVNQNLIAKTIGELTFEEVLTPIKSENWLLTLKSGVTYRFSGIKTVWGHLRIRPETITREGLLAENAALFFVDSQNETGMSDITLGNFLEEMHNTLSRDLKLLNRMTIQEVAALDDLSLQRILNGHPKILLNKGRIGWGKEASETFSPESAVPFQLRWIAVKKDCLEGKITEEMKDLLTEKDLDYHFYHAIPVHPWQWDKYIAIQFADMIADKKIVDLGIRGDFYLPQISIRTLSNITQPEKDDVKLPVSILNTSCIRGLTANTITLGSEVSAILDKICNEDGLLRESGTKVLREHGGVSVSHPHFSRIRGAPYRYHEFLGVLYREALSTKLGPGERTMLASALHFQETAGITLLAELVRLSGISSESWLRLYFKKVIIPLYHLQLEYGVGLVAHGQNIVLRLKNNVPEGVFLKDFQGDFRLLNKLPGKGQYYFQSIEAQTTRLPPEYLIHDLITGHFITVLRFISGALEETHFFEETKFYALLRAEIENYLVARNYSEYQDLLSPKIQKLLLNKVRFEIGYGDSDKRPLPLLGTAIPNPLLIESRNNI
jgi:aerobactin synthase